MSFTQVLRCVGWSLLVGGLVFGQSDASAQPDPCAQLGESDRQQPPAQRPPNVLFIAIDDLRTELGCYGVDDVQSPNLDELASRSVLFTHHYVQVPTCGASRYALLTGRSPAQSGVRASNEALYQGRTALRSDPEQGAASLPELFRFNGYHTVCIGKISHTPDGRVFAYNGKGDGRHELPNAWDDLATPFGPWQRGWGTFFAYANGRHREDGQGNKELMEFVAEQDNELPDGLMAEAAIEKLRELKAQGKPFFMGLGFFKPHLPFVATRGDWEAFADTQIAGPTSPEKLDSPYWHNSGEFYKYKMEFPKTRPLAADDAVAARCAYLACVRYTDRQVGRVLQSLDELGLSESTVVIVWGDHGWHLGESAIWGKHSPFERAVHSTLMIRAPGVSLPGTRCDSLVETTDLFPTLVDLCQLENRATQHPLDGESLKPLLTGKKESWRTHAISYWRDAVSLRTGDYRLIARANEGVATDVELYEMREGDDPRHNVAEQSPEIVATLLEQLGLSPKKNDQP